jgi:hypothetical protein
VNDDPFAVLGLTSSATLAEVREARRRLAFELHPDHGGDVGAMQRLNAAFDACVGHLTHRRPLPDVEAPAQPAAGRPTPARHSARQRPAPRRRHVEQDAPSFTVDALPAEAFEALLVVASWIGEVVDDDPPYMLECLLGEPAPCWCRLDLLPDAGGSTVSLIVASGDGDATAPVSAELVRDVWVGHLNQLSWPLP